MTAASWSINRRAAAAIARYAVSPTECRELLDMCGLLDDEGRIKPDDTTVHVLPDPGVGPGATNPDATNPRAFVEHGRRPEGMTTPAGLATLQPVVVPKPSKPLPPHGTRRRFRVEKAARNVCQPCRDAENRYYQERSAAKKKAKA